MKARFSFRAAVTVSMAAAVGAAAAMNVMSISPAFNAKLRHETIFQDWRAVSQNALYTSSEYFFEIGIGFLRGDFADLLRNDAELPSLTIYDQRLKQASALLHTSLSLSPGKEDAWIGLAWAELLAGNYSNSSSALRNSWFLAPYDTSAARERLFIVNAINSEIGISWQTDEDQDNVIDDIITIDERDPSTLDAIAN